MATHKKNAASKVEEGGNLRIVNRRNAAAEPSSQEDSLSWPQEDIRKLLSRMRGHVPNNDHYSHQSRAKSLPWDDIAFDNYSGEKCFHMWKLVLQRVRGYRLLGELLFDAENWLDKPWTNFYGSKKVNRHPDKPKLPPTPNGLYIKDHFQKLKEEFPDLAPKEIFKLANDKYKSISPKKKAKYLKKVNNLKAEYDRNLAVFLNEHPSERINVKNIKPKKLTAFNLYLEHQLTKNRDTMNGQSLKSFNVDVRNKWKSLKESKKLLWINKAKELEKVVFQSTQDVQPKSLLTKNEQIICDKAKGKPTKPPPNIYAYFSKTLLVSEEMRKYETKDRMKQISIRWKEITPDEKHRLEVEFAQQMKEYKEKLQEYYKKYPDEKMNEKEITKPKSKTFPSKKRTISESSTGDSAAKKPKLEHKVNDLKPVEKNEQAGSSNTESKRPPSDPIKYYKKLMKKQNIIFSSKEELNEAWENLSKKERKVYKKQHAKLLGEYETVLTS